MRARYYSPDSRRFITLDPVKGELTNTQSLNRYAYVQGNPVSAVDPLGLSPLLNLAQLLPDVETMLDIARILPGTGTIMGVYDLYQAVKEKDGKKFISTVAFLGMGAFGGIGKGIKFLNKAEKLSDRAAGVLQFANNAIATAYQGELFCESIDYALEEMKAGSGKLSDISTTSWVNIAVSGIATYLSGRATVKSIPRHTPAKLKTKAAGKGKTGTTAAKEVSGEMPAVSGKVSGGSGSKTEQYYYHVTTKEAAEQIIASGELGRRGNSWESRVFAWTKQPTKRQASIAGIGKEAQTVIRFNTNASFEPDIGNRGKSIADIVVQTTDGQRVPISVKNVEIVGYKKEWWQFWKK